MTEAVRNPENSIQARARRALVLAAKLDNSGYFRKPEDNLLPGIPWEQIRGDFERGAGHELDRKMCAAHSSSALAVNTFGRWVCEPSTLSVLGLAGFERPRFEHPCRTGLGGTPPHLDVLTRSDGIILAIESKCLEYLRPHKATFSKSYDRISDFRSGTAWFRQIKNLRAHPLRYKYLDAAQLIKHYLDLSNEFRDRRVTLVYLFWEPKNPQSTPDFPKHREEIEDFSQAVEGSAVMLQAMSYPELWASWAQMRAPTWVRDHVKNLRARYEVRI